MSDATMADATKSEATKSEATIESVLQEQRVFQPPAALAATARIGSMAAYQALVDQAEADPDRREQRQPQGGASQVPLLLPHGGRIAGATPPPHDPPHGPPPGPAGSSWEASRP